MIKHPIDIFNEHITKLVELYGPETVAYMLMINSLNIYSGFLDTKNYKDTIRHLYKDAINYSDAKAKALH